MTDNLPFGRMIVDTDLSMTAVENCRQLYLIAFNREPDTLFLGTEEFATAKEVLDLLYDKRGIALNRILVKQWPPRWWSVGENSPFYGFGSPGV